VGLAGMIERVREIGGKLEINSTAAGTGIVARVPMLSRPVRESSQSTMQEVKG
jgi:signal transduction histidine kinase